MTPKQFFDWQTSGGTNDVMIAVATLERADIAWCAIDGIAVNHWATYPMVTLDLDLVVDLNDIERAVALFEGVGFSVQRFDWSINLVGHSSVSIQISTEAFYRDYPSRAVPAEVHGILMRVAALEDTLKGKIKALSEPARRQSKRIKDLADIARLIETHPHLWGSLTDELKQHIQQP